MADKMKSLKKINAAPTLALSLCIALMLAANACSGSSDAKPSTARASANQNIPVAIATASLQDIPYYLTGLGSVTAFNTVNVKSRVDGQLVQVAFKEGEHVKKGDLLAVIDPRPFEVQLSQAQAALFRDQAQLRDAKLNLERYRSLLKDSGALSQQQVDTQAATVDQLEGTVRSDQSNIDNAKLQITYCHITASVNGRVGLRLVDIGNIVHATDANPILVITQQQPISVIFTLPQDQLPAVAKRMSKGALPVDAYSRDDQTKLATGTLQTIDNQIDQTTGTGKLKAVFSNENDALWPNQFVNARLLLETHKGAIVVPAAAIQRGPQGTFVYVVKPDKTVDVREVKIGFTQNNMASIANGVSPNEQVVTDGQDKLQAGSHVVPRATNSSNDQTAQSPANSGPDTGTK